MSAYNFIGSVYAGNSDKRMLSGFPFPIKDISTLSGGSVGNGGTHPVLLPLDTVTPVTAPSHNRQYRRGRYLSVDTDLAIVDSGSVPRVFPNGVLPLSSTDRTDELEILTNYDRLWRDNTVPGFDVTVQLHGTALPIASDGPNTSASDKYLDIKIAQAGGIGSIAFSSVAVDISTPDGTADGSIDAATAFDIYWVNQGAISVTFTYFRLYWSEFWSWDGKFNTTTGALI